MLDVFGKILPKAITTVYLIFSYGDRTITVEKNFLKAQQKSSKYIFRCLNLDDSYTVRARRIPPTLHEEQ